MKITRRALVQAAALVQLAPVALAQTAPPPGDLLAQAKEQTKRTGETLAKIPLPMSTEPAFSFKA